LDVVQSGDEFRDCLLCRLSLVIRYSCVVNYDAYTSNDNAVRRLT